MNPAAPSTTVHTPQPSVHAGPAHSPLAANTETKLRVAAIAEVLLTLAEERKDDERKRAVQRLLADLAEDAFRLAVLGKYNRGKSSLMNALLGAEWLPTGVLPLTSVVTTVRYGTKERVIIQTEGSSLIREVPLSELADYVTEERNSGNRKRVTSAEIQLPAELLRYGFLFIDTPGLGSGIAANTEATRRFLPEIDAAIILLSFESPLDDADLQLIQEIRNLGRRFFVVLNKADLVPAGERAKVVSFVSDRLKELLGSETPLFALSARDGLRARLQAETDAVEDSGLITFERELVRFLTTQKAELFLNRAVERVSSLLEQERLENVLARQVISDEKKSRLLAGLQQKSQDTITRITEIMNDLAPRITESFTTMMRAEVNRWCRETKVATAGRFWEGHPEYTETSLNEFVEKSLARNLEAVVAQFEKDLTPLTRAVDDLRRAGGQLLEERTCLSGKDGWTSHLLSLHDVSMRSIPPFAWSPSQAWLTAIPTEWMRQKVIDRFEHNLSEALNAYCEATRPYFEEVCRRWLEQTQNELVSTVSAYVARLEEASRRPESAETLSILDDLNSQLKEVKKGIVTAAGSISETDHYVAPSISNEDEQSCLVCKRTADASFEYLRRFQYQLIKDPAMRQENSERGGFCPFHAWMYESMSSPQGIAQGYVSVLKTIASRFDSILKGNGVPGEIADKVAQLLPNFERCRICEVARIAEQEAFDEILHEQGGRDRPAPLCLIHLVPVIQQQPDESFVRERIQEQASRLNRLAEDMEQFALKHSGLRRHLSTEGERSAYIRGLMQVVGSRQLSFVRQINDLI